MSLEVIGISQVSKPPSKTTYIYFKQARDWFTGVSFEKFYVELHLPRQLAQVCPLNRPPIFLLHDQETSTHVVYKTKAIELAKAEKGLSETREWLSVTLPEIPCEFINTIEETNQSD